MPPKAKFTREEILRAAVDLVRKQGAPALTARGLGAALGSSARPIFTVFPGMEEVRQAVIGEANRLYQAYLREDMALDRYPPYKASGMAYIRFAREERELFRLLFMRDRSGEVISEGAEELEPVIAALRAATGLSREQAMRFHLEMWVYVHGMASMIATGYLNLAEETISAMLTDAYMGLKYRFLEEKGGANGSNSNH